MTMNHHQRPHHHSRRISHHDSLPKHSPPHDPHYPYHTPYNSCHSSHPCPYCSAPSTSFHYDHISGDLICTQCGVVLDDHLRDENAEWRDFGTIEDIARGNAPGKRARCGDVPTDETRWVGGLMPTTVGREPYYPSASAGGGGGGGGSNAEERQKLASLRSRLKRTHNMIENMLEKEQKERYREVVLDHKARAAKVARGEDDTNNGSNNNVMEVENSATVQGDYEALIAAERQQRIMDEGNTTLKSIAKTDENQYTALNNKWSLTHAILIHGTLEHVQEWAGDYNNGGREEWTHASLENERRHYLHKKLDATIRSSTHKLYVSFVLLEKAARALNFYGIANPTFREATLWLVKFATARDDLKISGISSGKKGVKHLDGEEEILSLSLFPRSDSDMMDTLLSSSLMAKSSPRKPSMWNELHRLKQYSALGAAILYISAKRTGVGRTLAEVCSAFGTYSIGADEIKRNDVESLVRPKYCSRAMEELKQILPDVLVPVDRTAVQPVKTPSSSTNLREDKLSMVPSTEQLDSIARVTPDYLPSDMSSNAEESALADLISRMASSLNLPSSAAVAARTVATLCKIGGSRVSNEADKAGISKHIRPRQKKSKMKSDPDEIIAASTLLLVSTAGGIMQRLAEQALSNAGASCEIGVDTFASWNEWNSQSSWHRDVSDLEQCTGLPSKDILDCYSKSLYHRRVQLLEAVKLRFKMGNEERERLLQNIVVAVPLMSLRHIGR